MRNYEIDWKHFLEIFPLSWMKESHPAVRAESVNYFYPLVSKIENLSLSSENELFCQLATTLIRL